MNTTERNEVIRECIMTIGEVVMSDDDWGKGYGEGYNDARGVLEALLSPTDQEVALRELQRLGQEADASDPDAWTLAHTEDWTPCERTKAACLEAIDKACGGAPNHHRYQNAILSVKAQPDRAEELVEQFLCVDGPVFAKPMDRDPGVASVEACREFARWAISNGHLVSKEKLA